MESSCIKFQCRFCKLYFASRGNLGHHYIINPTHKPEQEDKIESSSSVSKKLLEGLSVYHRKARIKELLKLVSQEEISEVVLPFTAGKCSTYQFLKAKCSLKRSKRHINDLVLEEITSAKKIVDEEVKKSQLLAEIPLSILNAKMQIKNPQKFIDLISIDDQENTFKTSLDIETLCERIITENDGFMLKNILMPKFVEKHEEALTEFSVGLLTNFDISQTKYQDILRCYLGQNLQKVTGLNPVVPRYKAVEKMRATKKKLQELVGFGYVVKGNLVAAYTNVEKHLRFLLSQPGMTEALPMPRNTLLIYDYLDEFRNLSWSYFSGSQTKTFSV